MPRVTLIRGARQLLTLHGPEGPRRGAAMRNLGLIQDGAVLVVDGRIQEVGPSRRLENLALARQAEEIDASGRVVMPGLIDSHSYLIAGPARILDYEMRQAGATREQIAEAGGDILALARAIQGSSPRALESQAMRAVDEAVRHGTTTLEAKSGFGLTEAGELKILRIHAALQKRSLPVVSTFVAAHVPPNFANHRDRYVEWLITHLLPLITRRRLAEFAAIRCEADAFTLEQARRYLLAARELGIGRKLHAGHRPHPGAVRLALEMEAASIDHLQAVTAEDARHLGQSSTIAVLLPGTSFYLRTRAYAPARMLISAGAPVALASNYNPISSPSQNMQMIVALACTHMDLTPAEAITAATMNAACALRLETKIGSLELGKDADLIILGVPDYREMPYHFGVNLVDLVMKSGTVLVRRSEVQWPAN